MKVIIISGATATGKTQMALELADLYSGEIVNFDSLLFYHEISIGTAKPSSLERQKIPHHMIDIRSIESPMNAADFSRKAFPIVEEILGREKIVFLVGGSGFYLQALLKGMYESSTTPQEIIDQSNHLYQVKGIRPFLDILEKQDPKSFYRYHQNDHYRIRRAVEHWWATGRTLSESREKKDKENLQLDDITIHPWKVLHLHMNIPKDQHLEIIQKRTATMIEQGLVEEVLRLQSQGFSLSLKPLQSIGYKETVQYVLGEIKNLQELEERINISTRQLAKAQKTWFKRDQYKISFNPLVERNEIFQQVDRFMSM